MTRFLTALCVLAFACAPVQAKSVQDDPGGNVYDRIVELDDLKAADEVIEIGGYCASACTLYLNAPGVCITKEAIFAFHQPYFPNGEGNPADVEYMTRIMMVLYPGWVRKWIRDHGGLTPETIVMDAEFVAQHVPLCKVEVVEDTKADFMKPLIQQDRTIMTIIHKSKKNYTSKWK